MICVFDLLIVFVPAVMRISRMILYLIGTCLVVCVILVYLFNVGRQSSPMVTVDLMKFDPIKPLEGLYFVSLVPRRSRKKGGGAPGI